MERRPFLSMLATLMGAALAWLFIRPRTVAAAPWSTAHPQRYRAQQFVISPEFHRAVNEASVEIASRLLSSYDAKFQKIVWIVQNCLLYGNVFVRRYPDGDLITYDPFEIQICTDRYSDRPAYVYKASGSSKLVLLQSVRHIRMGRNAPGPLGYGWSLPPTAEGASQMVRVFEEEALAQLKALLTA